MEYRLTLDTLVIGSLTACLSILTIAWILDWLGRHQEQSGHGTHRNDDQPGGDTRHSSDRETRHVPEIYPAGVFDKSRFSDMELGRVPRRETGRPLRRRVG